MNRLMCAECEYPTAVNKDGLITSCVRAPDCTPHARAAWTADVPSPLLLWLVLWPIAVTLVIVFNLGRQAGAKEAR